MNKVMVNGKIVSMRITRRHIISAMWAGGRPSRTDEFADLFFAAAKAGLNNKQSMAIACAAFDTANGNVERLSQSVAMLRYATLERKAADARFPTSIWAYLRAKLGARYCYVTNEQIEEASVNDYAGWSAWADKMQAHVG